MSKLETKGYNLSVLEYTQGGSIFVQRDCKAVAIINIGDTIATLNDVPVFPSVTPATIRGDVFTFSGDELETYKGNLTLKFVAPIGANPKVTIIQQYYTENY